MSEKEKEAFFSNEALQSVPNGGETELVDEALNKVGGGVSIRSGQSTTSEYGGSGSQQNDTAIDSSVGAIVPSSGTSRIPLTLSGGEIAFRP